MRKTPQYDLTFYQAGDLYRASDDLDRMVVIDNQLAALSKVVGDGVLSGWTLSLTSGLEVRVSPGSGFIGNVLHRTLSSKTATVFDGATTLILMRSSILGTPGPFIIDLEGPSSEIASANFVDSTPPGVPTSFAAVAVSLDVINLTWDANGETDFDHYDVFRALSSSGPFSLAFSTNSNGTLDDPLQDTGLDASTSYFYEIKAIDISGNASAATTASTATLPDTRKPGDVTNLILLSGNGQVALGFTPSPSDNVTEYLAIVERIGLDGKVAASSTSSLGLDQTAQLSGAPITNGFRHKITIRSRSSAVGLDPAGNLSDGTSGDVTPQALPAPLDVTGLTVTPGIKSFSLSWTASVSATGPALGQKSQYLVTVLSDNQESNPINVGLATSITLNSFDVGQKRLLFEDDKVFFFKVVATDSFGNQSGGVLANGSTIDITPPKRPRAISATPGDAMALVRWRHSESVDVVGYNLAIDSGSGFGPDVKVGYVEEFDLTGLPNGSPLTIRIKARDDVGNLSPGIDTVTTPEADVTPPPIPQFIRVNPEDRQLRVTWGESNAPDFDHFVVRRQAFFESIDAPPNRELTVRDDVPKGGTTDIDPVTGIDFLDTGLQNGITYGYQVKAVDVRGNESGFSSLARAVPSEGVNSGASKLVAPTGLVATFAAGSITLAWAYTAPDPTDFNIFRSLDPVVEFDLIGSVPGSERSFVDSDLIGGKTYYYRVSAIRDSADVLVDTGAIQPANTILLGIVKASSGVITSLSNTQRLVDRIQATLGDETLSRLLSHRHSARPINSITSQTQREVALVDASELATLTAGLTLSGESKKFFDSMMAKTFAANTTFVPDPAQVVDKVPFVGDFSILVNGDKPVGEFMLDHDLNAIVFAEPLGDNDLVMADGTGFSRYVPAVLDSRFRGYRVLLGGDDLPSACVDESTNTIRFPSPLADDAVITVEIEPAIPDFTARAGARQVGLSPDLVISDFKRKNQTTYVSSSGGFKEGDSLFVLVNGDRTSLEHAIEFASNAIIFDVPLPSTAVVSLEIVGGGGQVDGALPASRVGNIDGSQVKSGRFIRPQLPELSHEGRVMEMALPLFRTLSSDNGYVYSGPQGITGNGVTPYSIFRGESAQNADLLVGTSAGLLRSIRSVFLAPGNEADIAEQVRGLRTSGASDVTSLARNALPFSGRLDGEMVINGELFRNMVLIGMNDGKTLLFGGESGGGSGAFAASSNKSFIFDPVSGTFSITGNMAIRRVDHAGILLPNGRVLACGGRTTFLDGTEHDLATCEIFDPVLGTWSPTGSLSAGRSLHSLALVDPSNPLSDVLVAGGRRGFTSMPDNISAFVNAFSDITDAQRFEQSVGTWRITGSLNVAVSGHQVKFDGMVIVDGFDAREAYDAVAETWSKFEPVLKKMSKIKLAEVDGPIKQFFEDSTGVLLIVTRNNVFESRDGGVNMARMRGLESVGVVHRISEVGGTLFAATDLGAYEITADIRESSTWFQGGLIGAGTTEAFDLQSFGLSMLVATQIGVFSSSDDGVTWTQLVALDDVFNIEKLGDILFAQSGRDMFRSDDGGATWSRVTTLAFLDSSTLMTVRGQDLFLGTPDGLFSSRDGISFSLVNFDLNRDAKRNSVQMLNVVGDDVMVGYHGVIFSIDAGLGAIRTTEFVGTIPTIRVNGIEVESGFRYDTRANSVTFESKRLSGDTVEATANYSLYQMVGGGWSAQRPNAPVTVFKNRAIVKDSEVMLEPRLGQIAFSSALTKFDDVTATIIGTFLVGAGEMFHDEIEDKMSMEEGLSLSLGRTRAGNTLQMGLAIEHNFLERGLERNQYYCLTGSMVDRSFNSFLSNSEFMILGRRQYDVFNSTLDFRLESSQEATGPAALVSLSNLEVAPSELWVGTESGVFVLDPMSGFKITGSFALGGLENAVREMRMFQGDVIAATRDGIFSVEVSSGRPTFMNPGNGLPTPTWTVDSLNNVLIAGTVDGIFFSTSASDPAFGEWTPASLVDEGGTTEIQIEGQCKSLFVQDGLAVAGIGNVVFASTDGKIWRRAFVFDDLDLVISDMGQFANKVYLGTTKGVFSDDGTARSDKVRFRLEQIGSTPEDSIVAINDVFVANNALYVVGENPLVYRLRDEAWTRQDIEAPSVHQFVVTSGGSKVALSNNLAFVE